MRRCLRSYGEGARRVDLQRTDMVDDVLRQQLRYLPAFRALLRSVESGFYKTLPLPRPTLDVGCGDGRFAALAFDERLDVGLDPWWQPLTEARDLRAYRLVTQANGAHMPFADNQFASAISNSVLEHIPDVDAVLTEITRVLRPGAPFYFCVPSDRFLSFLSIGRALDAMHMFPLAKAYRRFFNRISRHHHCDDADTWRSRLDQAALTVDRCWGYFSREALGALEWGHYLGLPSLISKKLTGRWVIGPVGPYLWLTDRLLRRYYEEPLPAVGSYLFFVAHKR